MSTTTGSLTSATSSNGASTIGSLYGDLMPQSTDYNAMFGGVPGRLSAPPSVYQELGANVPGFGNLTGAATSGVQSELKGQLSPSTMMNIGNYAAARGVAMGQPNSPIMNEVDLSTTGNTSEGLVQLGIGNYNALTGLLGSEQLNPQLVSELSEQNAVDAAAPDPEKAAWYQQALATGLMRTSPAGSAGSGFSTAMGDISSVLGLVGMGGGNGGGGSSVGGGGGSGIGAILGML